MVGRSGIYYGDGQITFASYLVKFVTDRKKLLPEYLTAFLNCKYGILDIKRRARQSINQTNVNPEEIKEIEIPLLTNSFQTKIQNNFINSHQLRLKSEYIYSLVSSKLLKTIGFDDFESITEKATVKSFSDSFGVSGRLDAEFYQKKYELVKAILKGVTGRFTLHDTNFTPINTTKYHYIELSDIGINGNITGATVDVGASLPTRARRKLKSGQVLVSSVEGSLESCAIVPERYNNALCSTGFYVVDSKYYTPETLLMLFKSFPIQEFAVSSSKCNTQSLGIGVF